MGRCHACGLGHPMAYTVWRDGLWWCSRHVLPRDYGFRLESDFGSRRIIIDAATDKGATTDGD